MMKVPSRVMSKVWSLSRQPSDLDKYCTGLLLNRTELLEKHIEVIQGKLDVVSSMEQDLAQLLEALLNIIKTQRKL